jgi:hypothetical protein
LFGFERLEFEHPPLARLDAIVFLAKPQGVEQTRKSLSHRNALPGYGAKESAWK